MENLKSFLDNELDLAAKTEVEAQLRNEPDLEVMAADFKMLSANLQSVDTGTPYGLDKLELSLNKEKAVSKSSRNSIWKWSALSSALGLLMVVFVAPKMMSKGPTRSESIYKGSIAPQSDAEMSKTEAAAPASELDQLTSQVTPMNDTTSARDGFVESRAKLNLGGRINADTGQSQSMPVAPVPFSGEPKGIYLEKSGEVSVKVDDLMRVIDEVTGIAKSFDGFVTNSNLQNQEQAGTAYVTLRIPTKNYAAAMNRIQKMGEVLSVSSASADITSETIDNTSRMETWAIEEQRLIDELKNAKNTKERLTVRRQLMEIRANLEAYRAEVKSLRDRAQYSTINASFVRGDAPIQVGRSWSQRTFQDAKEGLGSMGQFVGAIGIYGLVFSPIWLPLLIGFVLIRRKGRV
jgi:hypothetical protein